jgi:hypothetical protein
MNQVISERRDKSRITCHFSAIVRGRDENGKAFEEQCSVINLSASGSCLLINRSIPIGDEIYIKIALPTGSLKLGTSKLATYGIVVRTEPYNMENFEVSVKFIQYRFL